LESKLVDRGDFIGRQDELQTYGQKGRLFAAIKEAQEEIEQHGAEPSGSIDFDGS
jgi:hypothetical protein